MGAARLRDKDRLAADAAKRTHRRIDTARDVSAGLVEQRHACHSTGIASSLTRNPGASAALCHASAHAVTMRRHRGGAVSNLTLQSIVLVMLGSGLGGGARLWLSTLVQRATSPTFPWGTLFVNVAGCLLVGALGALLAPPGRLHDAQSLRVFLVTGVLGRLYDVFGLRARNRAAVRAWPGAGRGCVRAFVDGGLRRGRRHDVRRRGRRAALSRDGCRQRRRGRRRLDYCWRTS